MNKKGTTLIELIVTITLISMVLLFLFRIVLTLNNDNNLSGEEIEILSVKNSVIKEIEECYISKGKNAEDCNYEISKPVPNTIGGYKLPGDYRFKKEDEANNNDNSGISKEIIKIIDENGNELDYRFTIKLYYYEKNN